MGPEPIWTLGDEKSPLRPPGFETQIYIIIIIIIIINIITPSSTYTLANLHLSLIVGGIGLSQVKEIHPTH
jgi:hypothetical protein